MPLTPVRRLSALSQFLWWHKRWTGEVTSCGNRKPILSRPECRNSICRPCCLLLLWHLLSDWDCTVCLSWDFSKWPWARAKGFCSAATCDQTHVSKKVFVPNKILKSGFQSSCLDWFFRFSSWFYFFVLLTWQLNHFGAFSAASLFNARSFLSRHFFVQTTILGAAGM